MTPSAIHSTSPSSADVGEHVDDRATGRSWKSRDAATAWLPRRRGSTAGLATEEIAMSESAQDQPAKTDEAPKPGEPDTETVAGQPRKAPESKDGEQQPKQDQ
jgi:hypothetical protein